ncbi:hypothetical protein AM1_C0088 (plasmid) [Acaryochloris marina MBIC11017]|uniref:Uncharacterized protein n=1 Tax=Acaryochloris marina (strain MBIC 11017) TaxID=329726 RepID=A8ZMI5_ACAM1|nr:hypothetical protein AM1_C0088 [Acaryochloris marina MBIC11017]
MPSYGCEINDIEHQWPDPQVVMDAAHLGPKTMAEMIALQCPSFKFLGNL